MYVTDSLFFLQHLLAGNEHDENRQMFASKYRDILDGFDNPKPEESAEDIRERILRKSRLLTGEENECI